MEAQQTSTRASLDMGAERPSEGAKPAVALQSSTVPIQVRFSVCIPNYNYGRYIGQTLESVLSQSYPHFEVIVADNASTDDSVRVVESFHDPRVRLIRNQYNIGFAPNLDRATASARHEFMLLLSSDDLMRPGALASYAQVLSSLGDRASNAVLTSAIDEIDSEGNLRGVSYRPQGMPFYQSIIPDQAAAIPWTDLAVEKDGGLEILAQSLRAKNVAASFLATCYPRRLYEQVEGYHSPYRIFPDTHYLNKMLSQNPLLVYVPQRLFAYRIHDNNQLASEAASGALKYQVDAYMHTVEFPQDVLNRMGVKRTELVDVFVEKAVMERGLQALAAGYPARAFKCLAFGFATYPGRSLREGKTYALAALTALGPIGSWIARRLYSWHHRRRS